LATPAVSNPWLDQHYAVPQTLVKIGRRRRLNLLIAGQGAPTVIFAAGMNGTTLHWARVQRVIGEKTRTVAFDKAGFGFSDPGPPPRTAAAVVKDLRAALKAADIAPPYVLVGHSAGGPQMRLFAFRHTQEVVGMVIRQHRDNGVSADVTPLAALDTRARPHRHHLSLAGRGARRFLTIPFTRNLLAPFPHQGIVGRPEVDRP
jgi:pimeloyl-ACP methyl ester carboxylesterase